MTTPKHTAVVLPRSERQLPQRVDIVAGFASQNIRFFIIILMMGVICLASIAVAWKEGVRADNNIKIVWLKMYPNGTWDMEFHDEDRQPEFFRSTVDYLLTQWVERRFSEIPHAIKNDYGIAYIFMSSKLQAEFIDPKGYDAKAKAVRVMNCKSKCKEVHFKVKTIDHYDSDKAGFGQHEGTLYRTNIFAQKTTLSNNGRSAPQKLIVSIHWRIKSKEEIQADKKVLKQNPIGLEILMYELLEDVS